MSPKQFCFVFVLLSSLAFMALGAQKKYEPQLVANRPYKLTLSGTKPIAFFRLHVARTPEIQGFDVQSSACTGKITLYMSSCEIGKGNCDDASDAWFPDAISHQSKSYSTLGEAGQSTLSFGRKYSNDKRIFFYGVELANSGQDQGTVQIVFKTFGFNEVQGTFMNSKSLSVKKLSTLNLEWKPPLFCESGDATDVLKCKKTLSIGNPKYTVYIQKLTEQAQEINMASECGLLMAPNQVKKVAVSQSSVELKQYITSDGKYLVNVGIELPSHVNNGYYAYTPIILTVQKPSPETESGNFNTVVLIACLTLGIVGVLLVGAGSITAYFIYKRRRGAYESVPYR